MEEGHAKTNKSDAGRSDDIVRKPRAEVPPYGRKVCGNKNHRRLHR